MNQSVRPMLLLIAYLAFLSLGLPDGTLGVAWPSIRESFTLPQSGLGLVLFAAGAGYFVSSFSLGFLVRRLGIGKLLTISTLFLMISLTGYAVVPTWPLFLLAAALAGLGSGAIDGGLNAYAATHFSGRHMNWLHASYGLGATSGPLIMTTVLRQGHSWQWGYLVVAGCLGLLTVAFGLTRQQWRREGRSSEVAEARISTPKDRTLRHPVVWMQVGMFVLYAGLEVTAGQWSYTLLTEARLVPSVMAGFWVSLYWGSLTAGRVLFGWLVDRISMVRLLRLCITGVLVGAMMVWVPITAFNFLGLALMGLSLAPVFPCLMKQTPERVGQGRATQVVGLQVSGAMAGVILLPSFTGVLVQAINLEVVGMALTGLTLLLFMLHEGLLFRLAGTSLDSNV